MTLKEKKLTGEILDELNYQFMRRLQKEGLLTLKECNNRYFPTAPFSI